MSNKQAKVHKMPNEPVTNVSEIPSKTKTKEKKTIPF